MSWRVQAPQFCKSYGLVFPRNLEAEVLAMKTCELFVSPRNAFSIVLSVLVIAIFGVSLTGCGSGTKTVANEATSVTVLLTSTANNQLSQLNINFTNITLTSQSGNTISLLPTPQTAEFIHLNGTAEPLLTVSLPQDVYTSASATIQNGGFNCVSLDQDGGVQTSAFGGNGPVTTTITLASPITVTGSAMGLLLDLQVGQSVTTSSCSLTGAVYSFTPTFNLTAVSLASTPTNFENGKETGLQGQILAVDSATSSFTVAAADGPTWSVQSNGNTVYQNAATFSALTAGTAVDMDLIIQGDGLLLATRVQVVDANPVNLTTWSGPLLFVATSEPVLLTVGAEQEGPLQSGGGNYVSFGSATFQISDQFANLQSLPFTAGFNASSMVAGQNIYIGTGSLTIGAAPVYIPAATITLMPQTINGTVTAVNAVGNFTEYTVALAAYDLFPDLAVQAGQTTVLTSPGIVEVYVDSSTQLLNTAPLAVGSLLRFNGLVFNDTGTLRMDCGQVDDGTAE